MIFQYFLVFLSRFVDAGTIDWTAFSIIIHGILCWCKFCTYTNKAPSLRPIDKPAVVPGFCQDRRIFENQLVARHDFAVFLCVVYRAVFRLDALHPLPSFNGCKCNRCTRSWIAPVNSVMRLIGICYSRMAVEIDRTLKYSRNSQ